MVHQQMSNDMPLWRERKVRKGWLSGFFCLPSICFLFCFAVSKAAPSEGCMSSGRKRVVFYLLRPPNVRTERRELPAASFLNELMSQARRGTCQKTSWKVNKLSRSLSMHCVTSITTCYSSLQNLLSRRNVTPNQQRIRHLNEIYQLLFWWCS